MGTAEEVLVGQQFCFSTSIHSGKGHLTAWALLWTWRELSKRGVHVSHEDHWKAFLFVLFFL